MDNAEFEQVVTDLIEAVNVEREAAHKRAALEMKVYEAVGIKAGDKVTKRAGKYTVAVENLLDYVINWPLLERSRISQELYPVKTEKVLDREALAWLRDNNADVYKDFLKCLKVTPGQTHIRIDTAVLDQGQEAKYCGAEG